MAVDAGARLLAVRCDTLTGVTTSFVDDLLDYFDPDLVYVVAERSDVRVVSRLRRAATCPVIAPRGQPVHVESNAGVMVAFASSLDFLGGASTDSGDEVPPDADYVVCDEVSTTTDAVTMTVDLDGRDHLARYQRRHDGTGATFLTGSLQASYDVVWEATVDGDPVRLPVRGLAPMRRQGDPELACLTLGPGGSVAVSSTPADSFGLRALRGVGEGTAAKLRDRGYETRDDVGEATEADLTAVHGIGDTTARRISQSVRVLEEERVIRLTDDAVPAADYSPLFVDIETDGLTPSIIWLVGVYDPARDVYTDFVDRDPSTEDPGRATREFVNWLASEYDRPALVAWNGYDFDFEHLGRFVAGHAPEFADYWADDVFEYDLYDWCVREDHALLPGRTNRLEVVARALGHARDPDAAAVDGKSLARAVQRIMTDPDRAHEMDWEAARAYCEADVRELAAVYETVAAATPGSKRTDVPDDENTQQTGLMDF